MHYNQEAKRFMISLCVLSKNTFLHRYSLVLVLNSPSHPHTSLLLLTTLSIFKENETFTPLLLSLTNFGIE